MAGSSKLSVLIVGDASSAQRAFADTGTAAEGMAGKVEGAAVGIKDAAMGMVKAFAPMLATFAVADFAKGAITGAENLKKAQDSLDIAIQHTGGSVKTLGPQYDAVAKSAAQFGVNQTDATSALAKATLLTGNSASAQRAYQEALVISKATGKDFNSVLIATSKGQDGITTSLSRYGVELKSGASGQEQFNEVMGRFGGQAAANTSAADKLRANFDNLSASVGKVLLPAFNAIIGGLNGLVNWLQGPEAKQVVQRFEAVFMAIAAVPGDVWNAFNTAWTTAWAAISALPGDVWTAFNTAWTTAWAAVSALPGDVWSAYNTAWGKAWAAISSLPGDVWSAFNTAWGKAWDAIKGLAGDVWNSFKKSWDKDWDDIKTAGSTIWGLFKTGWDKAWDDIKKVPDAIWGVFQTAWGKAWSDAKSLGETVGKDIINGLIGIINQGIALVDKFKWGAVKVLGVTVVPGFGGLNIPPIPTLDTGGTVMQTGLAVVHRGETFSGVGGGGMGPNVTLMPGAVVVHGTADAGFAQLLAQEIATQLRGGRVPQLASAIGALP